MCTRAMGMIERLNIQFHDKVSQENIERLSKQHNCLCEYQEHNPGKEVKLSG